MEKRIDEYKEEYTSESMEKIKEEIHKLE